MSFHRSVASVILLAAVSQAAGAAPPPMLRHLIRISTMTGICTRFVTGNKDHTSDCKGAIINNEYNDGRTSFTFVSKGEPTFIITFSGDGRQQIHQGVDVAIQPVDVLIMSFGRDTGNMRSVGNCRFSNPYKPAATVSCSADTPQGQFEANFESDGSPPQTQQIK